LSQASSNTMDNNCEQQVPSVALHLQQLVWCQVEQEAEPY